MRRLMRQWRGKYRDEMSRTPTVSVTVSRLTHKCTYDRFLAAVDAEAKAGQGQMMGGMQQARPEQLVPSAPPVGTALGEMSVAQARGPSGEALQIF
jgi:hypothetical protein